MADNPYDADAEMRTGRGIIMYKRWAKKIRMPGLIPERDYCFKGNYITVDDYRGGYYATLSGQDWRSENESSWFCTRAGESLIKQVDDSSTNGLFSVENDFLIQDVSVNTTIEKKTINGKEQNGHKMKVVVHNAGTNTINANEKTLSVTCVGRSPSAHENTITEPIDRVLTKGDSYRMNLFITRKMVQMCRENFEITLSNDDITFNNVTRVRLDNNSESGYFIRHY
jgi:hypothetical protein